jgi:hypothetical protein
MLSRNARTGETYLDLKVRFTALIAAAAATLVLLSALDHTGVVLRRQALAERASPLLAASCGSCRLAPRVGLVL